MSEHRAFAGLVDLAGLRLGGKALGTSDDFFAGADNLIVAEPARFEADRYTEQGKWMDGWESRRRRGRGHDSAVIELGASGRVLGFDIDTAYFKGNHPPFAAVDGLVAAPGTPFADLERRAWRSLLTQVPLGPDCHNYFPAEANELVSHVRLSIFPDGGVARFRVYGRVAPDFGEPDLDQRARAELPAGVVDLAALRNGATTLVCSDARFGEMQSLILPGRSPNMGGGWETRRGRPPDHGHDWIIVKLAARGLPHVMELDTQHFKGNFPERCSLEGINWPEAAITELLATSRWQELLPPTPLSADTRHFFRDLRLSAPISHVRLNIFPDGGVSRLRLWGEAAPRQEPHAYLDGLVREAAREALLRCCGSTRWADGMLAQRPFGSTTALAAAARDVWLQLARDDYLEAFAAHPAIGAQPEAVRANFPRTHALSEREQAGVGGADARTLSALEGANRAYLERFGYLFIVCATGKTAAQMLELLNARLAHSQDHELRVAAAEQLKITELRLARLGA